LRRGSRSLEDSDLEVVLIVHDGHRRPALLDLDHGHDLLAHLSLAGGLPEEGWSHELALGGSHRWNGFPQVAEAAAYSRSTSWNRVDRTEPSIDRRQRRSSSGGGLLGLDALLELEVGLLQVLDVVVLHAVDGEDLVEVLLQLCLGRDVT
jgi:hypothetical protein